MSRFDVRVYAMNVLLGALAGLGPLAIDMYLPSFPSIAADFHVSTAVAERTVAAYFTGLAMGDGLTDR